MSNKRLVLLFENLCQFCYFNNKIEGSQKVRIYSNFLGNKEKQCNEYTILYLYKIVMSVICFDVAEPPSFDIMSKLIGGYEFCQSKIHLCLAF